MRKLAVPLIMFILGLFVADYFFGFDIPELFEGFGGILVGLFGAARN